MIFLFPVYEMCKNLSISGLATKVPLRFQLTYNVLREVSFTGSGGSTDVESSRVTKSP